MKTKMMYESPSASVQCLDGADVVTLSLIREDVGEIGNTRWKLPESTSEAQ